MSESNIEWTDKTWNPVTGCTKVSPGCTNCYAKRDWVRLQHLPRYNRPFEQVECHPDRLDQPLHWTKPSKIFVCHNGDLFHESVPSDFIADVFNIMAEAKHHIFQILTKRPERMRDFMLGNSSAGADYDPYIHISQFPNIWYGVSVENQPTADQRIPLLLQIPAAIRWLSIEPMLGPIDITMALEQFHSHDPFLTRNPSPVQWVVVGGESGPEARPMHPGWARSISDQCHLAGVPFFFKQWGNYKPICNFYEKDDDILYPAVDSDHMLMNVDGQIWNIDFDFKPPPSTWIFHRMNKKAAGRTLDGRTHDEYPENDT